MLISKSTSTHKRLRNLAKPAIKKDGDAASTHTSECSICLMSVAVCLFIFEVECQITDNL